MPLERSQPDKPARFSLLGIIGGLMVSEHLGDVRDEIDFLCDLAGIPRPEVGFEEGWTDQDWANVNSPRDPNSER